MSGYIGNIPVPQATQTRQSFTATASQTTFNTAGYSVGYVDVFLNGVKLAPADYTATNGSDIILAVGAASGDILETVAYEIFQVVDQDFTGDFTVDGSTFVVDSTNNRVGIGTTAPSQSIDTTGKVRIRDGGNTTIPSLQMGSTGVDGFSLPATNTLSFITNSTERMRIDSSGNVGIGTSSPASVGVAGMPALSLMSTTSGRSGAVYWQDTGGTTAANSYFFGGVFSMGTTTSHPFAFKTGDTEAMRIDSSGNLLVGQTSANSFNLTSGFGFDVRQTYGLGVAVQDNPTAIFNRTNTDGDIVAFRKNGTTVGSIGTASSRLHIENGDTGLRIAGDLDQIFPCGSGGGDRDAAIDLGSTGVRFKDLYLSGGVYLGGTGASNKLDDYEEGTWTPTFDFDNPATGITYNERTGTYTKVGRLVTVQAVIVITSKGSGGSGRIQITGLPFSPLGSGTNQYSGSVELRYMTISADGIHAEIGRAGSYVRIMKSRSGLQVSEFTEAETANNSGVLFTITYETT